MQARTKFIITAMLLGAIGLAGVAHLVQAAQIKAPAVNMPEYRISSQKTQSSDGDGETNDDRKEQDKETNDEEKEVAEDRRESAKLQRLAKITPQQAQKAAETAQGGKSSRIMLENEDGNLVYTVAIGQKEVIVDAGNGRVLYTETLNREDKVRETSHPRSSIQVSAAPGGDGDGETNDDG